MAATGCLKTGNFRDANIHASIVLGGIHFGANDHHMWHHLGMSSSVLGLNFGGHTDTNEYINLAPICSAGADKISPLKFAAASKYIEHLQNDDDGLITQDQAELILGTHDGGATKPHSVQISKVDESLLWVSYNMGTSILSFDGEGDGQTRRQDIASGILTRPIDLSTEGYSALVLFDKFTINDGRFVRLKGHLNSKFKAGGSKILVSGDGDFIYPGTASPYGLTLATSPSEPADVDTDIIITATGTDDGVATTIEHGSFLYFNSVATGGNCIYVFGVLRTNGGTVAVTFETAAGP